MNTFTKRVCFASFTACLFLYAAPARAGLPETVLSQGPAGYWRLNEATQPPPPQPAANAGSLGTAGNGNYLNGPKKGEPGAFPLLSATSVRFFNPTHEVGYGGSKVEVPYTPALNPNGPFSVEFWAKPTTVVTDVFCTVASIDSDPTLGGTNSDPRAGWLFYQNGNPTNGLPNRWQFRIGNTNGYADADSIIGGTVLTGAWQHIVGTYDGAKATLYVNGQSVASHDITNFHANAARPFRMGTTCFDGLLGNLGTYAGNRGFDGWLQEVAFYGSALSSNVIAAHYNTGQTNATAYASTIQGDKPIGYWRLGEPGNPLAANLGSLGSDVDGQYIYSAHPGQAGPQPPAFSGFDITNRACAFSGTNGFVDLPPLNLNTNTVTITAWILASGIQENNAGIVFSRQGTTVAGLKFDINDPNGLSYNWNADNATFNFKSGLTVPEFQWSFVALIVQPDQAVLCLQDGTTFTTSTNYTVHPDQAFEGETLIGRDSLSSDLTFHGTIDEVAIFNRALSVGEVFSQYASAVGGIKPVIYADVAAPEDGVYDGDTLVLTVDAGGTPPLSYQWRKDGNPIAGATSSTFTKPGVTSGDAGVYSVLVSNEQGSVTSQSATISVQAVTQPTLIQGPQSVTLYKGASLNLTVQASGGGLIYQWQKNGTNVIDATNSTYKVDRVLGEDAGSYLVIVSNRLNTLKSGTANVNVIVPAAGSYADAVVNDGPEAWWRLDDPAGAIILTDAMGRHHGLYKGSIALGVPGVLVGDTNSAASFDGSSAYAEVPFSRALNTTNFTMECWVKPNIVAKAIAPLSTFTQPPGRGHLFQKSEDGKWYYMWGDGSSTAVLYIDGSDVVYGQWSHLAVTYDGTFYTAYLNGNRDFRANPTVIPNNVAPFRIGYDQPGDGWNDYWNGEIDEVAVYSTALSAQQIAAHYSAGRFGSQVKPQITKQPESTPFGAGEFFFLETTVSGSQPIALQWTKNGVPMTDRTNRFLAFDPLSVADSGVYQLVASNAFGVVTSEPATLAVVPPPDFANVTNGLVLHLPFDGNYQDTSGRGNHATAQGSPRFVTGNVGRQALHYSTAVDDSDPLSPVVLAANYATLGTRPDLQFSSNVNFSVSFWIRFTGTPGDLPFLANAINSFSNPGYVFAPSYQAGGWSWSLGSFENSTSIGIYGFDETLNDGNWHHLLHTFDRTGSALTYLDGIQVDSRSVVPAGDIDTGDATNIGQDPTGEYPEAGQADIDDLAVWRRILTPFEAYAIWSAGQIGNSFDTFGPVSLAVSNDARSVQLAWQAGTLLESDSLKGPWTQVQGAVAPYHKLSPAAARKFYKVQL